MQSKPEASHEHRNRARISVSSPEGIESMVVLNTHFLHPIYHPNLHSCGRISIFYPTTMRIP